MLLLFLLLKVLYSCLIHVNAHFEMQFSDRRSRYKPFIALIDCATRKRELRCYFTAGLPNYHKGKKKVPKIARFRDARRRSHRSRRHNLSVTKKKKVHNLMPIFAFSIFEEGVVDRYGRSVCIKWTEAANGRSQTTLTFNLESRIKMEVLSLVPFFISRGQN